MLILGGSKILFYRYNFLVLGFKNVHKSLFYVGVTAVSPYLTRGEFLKKCEKVIKSEYFFAKVVHFLKKVV